MTDSPIRQDWFFTFGFDHRLNGSPLSRRFVRIHGTEGEARRKMIEHFGTRWAFCYPSAEEAGVQRHDLTELRLEAAAKAPASIGGNAPLPNCPICRGTGKEPIVDDVGEPGFRWCSCTASTPADPPKVTSEEDQKAHPDSIDPSCPDCVGFPCPEHQPLRAVERVVHQLDAGRALCGKRGVPGEWGPRHVWVSIHQGPVSAVNCPGCLAMRDHPGVFGALVAVAEAAMHWRAQGSLSKWTTIPSRALALEVDAFRRHWAEKVGVDGASSRYLDPAAFDGERKTAVIPASLPGPGGALPELQVECSCGEVFAPMQCPRCERRHPPIVMAQRPMVWRAESGTYREVEPEEYTDAPPYKRTVELLRQLVTKLEPTDAPITLARAGDQYHEASAILRQVLDAFEAEDLEQ